MSEPRDFASLSPRLLARKGGARPAMRPQDTSKFTAGGIPIDPHRADDLGWNDFGHGYRPEPANLEAAAAQSAKAPASAQARVVPVNDVDESSAEPDMPEVLRQIEEITCRVGRVAAPARAMPEGRRAAFTLRLEAERHFRLKMAGVLLNRSAQIIVTEALDNYLSEMPELRALVGTARKPS